MENKKMIVLGSGAAACFVLGYLGLHFMGGEPVDDANNNIILESKEINNEEKKIKKDVLEEIKQEAEKVIEKTVEKVESGWGQFWKGAYEESVNKKETEASDYN